MRKHLLPLVLAAAAGLTALTAQAVTVDEVDVNGHTIFVLDVGSPVDMAAVTTIDEVLEVAEAYTVGEVVKVEATAEGFQLVLTPGLGICHPYPRCLADTNHGNDNPPRYQHAPLPSMSVAANKLGASEVAYLAYSTSRAS